MEQAGHSIAWRSIAAVRYREADRSQVCRVAHSGDRPRAGEGKYKGRAPTARAKSADIHRLAAEGLTRDAIATQLKIGVASVYRVLRAA